MICELEVSTHHNQDDGAELSRAYTVISLISSNIALAYLRMTLPDYFWYLVKL